MKEKFQQFIYLYLTAKKAKENEGAADEKINEGKGF